MYRYHFPQDLLYIPLSPSKFLFHFYQRTHIYWLSANRAGNSKHIQTQNAKNQIQYREKDTFGATTSQIGGCSHCKPRRKQIAGLGKEGHGQENILLLLTTMEEGNGCQYITKQKMTFGGTIYKTLITDSKRSCIIKNPNNQQNQSNLPCLYSTCLNLIRHNMKPCLRNWNIIKPLLNIWNTHRIPPQGCYYPTTMV